MFWAQNLKKPKGNTCFSISGPMGSHRRPQEPSRDPFCHRKALQPRILPPENLSTPGFGLGKTSLTAADLEAEAEGLEAEALAIRVKVHWAIRIRSGLLTKVWCLDSRFWFPKWTHVLDVVPDGLAM